MRTMTTIPILALVLIGGCAGDAGAPVTEVEEARFEGAEVESDRVPAEALARARQTANDLTGDLGGLLLRTLQEEGPMAALDICSGTAQERTASHASEGVYVRRVSDRVRNPRNAPDEAESRELERLAELHGAGQLPSEIVRLVRQGDERALHYLRPITVAPPCFTCHGPPEDMDPQVRALVRERYPDDAATGYAAGDLRGAVSVRVSLTE